jgi:NADH dehydrogenase
MVTGATGFVGRSIVRRLLLRGLTPVCLVRSASKLCAQHPDVAPDRLISVVGGLEDQGALQLAAEKSQAAIHLVGIIIQRRLRGQTFRRIHVGGTERVLEAVKQSGIRRFVHMSALGTTPDAVSPYHKTKWEAEELVRQSGLDWTIFRPSIIHGPDGEFMRLLKRFVCGLTPPVIPYFGSGRARLQPVSVEDVAHCFVKSLFHSETVGQVYPLGGPQAYSWIELYNTCRALMPRARLWKPMVSQPVRVAKAVAALSHPPLALMELLLPSVGMFRFDAGQVDMSQKDGTCDHTLAEKAFSTKMRSFEEELAAYADLIG